MNFENIWGFFSMNFNDNYQTCDGNEKEDFSNHWTIGKIA